MKNNHLNVLFFFAVLCGLFFSFGCSSGIESSPTPGVLRVRLQSDPADTSIRIAGDTLVVAEEDSFGVTIFQGRAYSGSSFVFLFKNTTSYRLEDITYDILAMDSVAQIYKQIVIYESFVPPIDYHRLQFGVSVSQLNIGCPEGKKGLFCKFELPVRLPEGVNPLLDFYQDFTVFENQVTEINVQISPFMSLQRVRDTYHFTPKVEIISVDYF